MSEEYQGKRFSVPSAAHAPEGTFTNDDTNTFIPVVTEPETAKQARRRNKRSGASHFRETDPYDLKGYRTNKHRRTLRIVSNVLFIVGLALVLGAAGMWAKSQWEYHRQDVEHEKLSKYAVVSDDDHTIPPQVDWPALGQINGDAVGWIQIPGTIVNFPVYQADDNETYLHQSAEGEWSLGGQVFMDCENTAPGMIDQQTIIYGHHLRNGAMFKPIADMDNQEMFDGIDTVWYATPDAVYELEPLLVYYTNGYDENVRQFNFSSTEDLRAYLTGLLAVSQTSRADAAEVIASCDQCLTLCTCNYEDGYGRTLLVCVPKPGTTPLTPEEGGE